jgi:hypothetical protein
MCLAEQMRIIKVMLNNINSNVILNLKFLFKNCQCCNTIFLAFGKGIYC